MDTSVLVFASVRNAPKHRVAVTTLERLNEAGETLSISRQALREFLAVLTRPGTFHSPVSAAEAVALARDLEAQFDVLEDGPAVTDRLLDLMMLQIPVGGRRIYDANIGATLLACGVSRLLTDNVVVDFARFAGPIEVVPLIRP